jgi:peroxiredoxin
MAASDSALDTTAAANRANAHRTTLLSGIAVAVAIMLAAVFIAGREGLDSVGDAGVNRTLLPKVGSVAPDFITEDVYGNPVRLSQFRGHPVWLMFWGSWCPPCRAEFPDIQAAYAQLAPRGLRMLGVSLRESPLDAASYAARNGATFLVLSDPDEKDTGSAYPILNFPTHIFIDSNGVIQAIVLEDMDTQQAITEANRLLEDDASPVPGS